MLLIEIGDLFRPFNFCFLPLQLLLNLIVGSLAVSNEHKLSVVCEFDIPHTADLPLAVFLLLPHFSTLLNM